MLQDDPTELVGRVLAGDQSAWNEMVARYSRLVWSIAIDHRLCEADAADVSQMTWITLAERLPELRQPERVVSWLVTIARRECLRLLRSRRPRAVDPIQIELAEPVDSAEQEVMRDVRDEVLWRAVNAMPRRCRLLLCLVAHNPELSYADLGGAVGVAPGTIGPAKSRCLAELRRRVVRAGLTEAAG